MKGQQPLPTWEKIYRLPRKYLMLSVPITLLIGFLIGINYDTSSLKGTLLYGTIVMIYSTMVGFNFKSLASSKGNKVTGVAMLLNFLLIPIVAYVLGMIFLAGREGNAGIMFAGLAMAALLPTSGMTITWTGLLNGNVNAAVKMTVFGLILGSILAPWYLLVMVGQYVEIDIWQTMKTILLVVFVPMILGHFTFKFIMRNGRTMEDFKKNVKPKFGPMSIWAMLYVIFVSISMGAPMIMKNLELVLIAVVVLLIFYALNFGISTYVALKFFNREDGIALVNGTVLRNLSLAIGLAATSFGPEAALIVTLAFIIQQQGISYYAQFSHKWFGQPIDKKV